MNSSLLSRFGTFIASYFKLLTSVMAVMFAIEHGHFLDGNIAFSNTAAFRFATILYISFVIIELAF